jgi:hypothetical protein
MASRAHKERLVVPFTFFVALSASKPLFTNTMMHIFSSLAEQMWGSPKTSEHCLLHPSITFCTTKPQSLCQRIPKVLAVRHRHTTQLIPPSPDILERKVAPPSLADVAHPLPGYRSTLKPATAFEMRSFNTHSSAIKCVANRMSTSLCLLCQVRSPFHVRQVLWIERLIGLTRRLSLLSRSSSRLLRSQR